MNHNYCFFTISIFVTLLFGFSAVAQDRPIGKGIEGTLTLGTEYDDNTNNYSEKYRDRFKNLTEPDRFHIVTFDDVASSGKLAIKGKFEFFKKRQTIFDASAFYKMYANNSVDQNGEYTVGLGQQLTRKTYFHATYSLVPHYYLYHFRDKDWQRILGNTPEVYQPFDYSKDVFSARVLRYFWKGSSLSGDFDYSRYFYNEHYTEYDSKRYAFSLHGSQEIHDVFVVTVNYCYGYNDAKGYDGDVVGETKKSSDDADDSFREHKGGIGVQCFLPELFGKEHSLSANGSLYYRDYTTPRAPEIDRTHAGRLEYTLHASAAYTISIAKPLALQVEYTRIQRWAGSSYAVNNEYLKNEKDYSKNTAAVILQYTIGK